MEKNIKVRMRGEPLELQAMDFCLHIHAILEAITKANEKHLGILFMNGKKLEQVVEQDILEFGIAIGRYDPEIKIYLEHNGYVHPYRYV